MKAPSERKLLHFRPWFSLCLILPLLAAIMSQWPGQAMAYVVELLYFQGESGDTGILLEWATGFEEGTDAFRIERANNAGGPFAAVDVFYDGDTVSLVPALGDPEIGATYEVIDETAGALQTHWYRLIEIEVDGDESIISDVIAVTFSATATPIVVVTSGAPTSTPAPTSTGRATATPTQTATATPTPTPDQTAQAQTREAESSATSTPSLEPTATPTVEPLVNTFPSPTPFRFPTATGGTQAGQPQPAGTPLSGYPAPGGSGNQPPPTPTLIPVNQQPTPEDIIEFPSPYPAAPAATGQDGFFLPLATQTAPIGADDTFATDILATPAGVIAPAGARGGRLFLWAAFAAAFLIFAAGVLGSIVVFSRHGSKGSKQ